MSVCASLRIVAPPLPPSITKRVRSVAADLARFACFLFFLPFSFFYSHPASSPDVLFSAHVERSGIALSHQIAVHGSINIAYYL